MVFFRKNKGGRAGQNSEDGGKDGDDCDGGNASAANVNVNVSMSATEVQLVQPNSPTQPPSALAVKAAALTTEDPQHSPTIINGTKFTIVVFLDRGILFNQQVLHPGEALSMTRAETGGGGVVPYKVHATIGDESCLPTRQQSAKNLVSTAVIPTAFVAGCLATAASAGILAGPSAALAPLVSGLVVRGVVIDAAALAAGGMLAAKASTVSELLIKKHPEKFACQSGRFLPGRRFLVVKGGLDDGDMTIEELPARKFRKTIAEQVRCYRTPMDTIRDKIAYYLPGTTRKETDEQQEMVEGSDGNDVGDDDRDDVSGRMSSRPALLAT